LTDIAEKNGGIESLTFYPQGGQLSRVIAVPAPLKWKKGYKPGIGTVTTPAGLAMSSDQ